MSRAARTLRSWAAFWWDFVVGDDWHIAAVVAVSLGVTAAVARTSLPSWWLVPVATIAVLAWSMHRAWREGRSR